MSAIASHITSLTVVYSTVYCGADQRKHQSSALLAFVWRIHRDRWIPRTKGQLRGKCFHLMTSSCENGNPLIIRNYQAMILYKTDSCYQFRSCVGCGDGLFFLVIYPVVLAAGDETTTPCNDPLCSTEHKPAIHQKVWGGDETLAAAHNAD